MLGGIEVKADDVAQFLNEAFVVGEFEGANEMGLKLMSVPDALHGGVAHPCMLSHGARGPVGGLLGDGVQGIFDNAFDEFLGVVAFSASPGVVDEALETVLGKATSPFGDGVLARCQLLGDVVASEKGERIPGFDSEAIWNELFRKTDCVLGTHPAPPAEDRKALVDELTTTIDQIIAHFLASISTTGVDARMDASFGIALYALTLTFELAHSPGRIFASGRILLRTIAECLITLTYLRVRDNPTLWGQFRNYGVGQTGLTFLKTSGLDDVPEYLDMEKLEMLANEDTWLEYQDIDFGAWANKNLRAMSEEVGVKDVYDRYYDWPSGFVHGNWGSIRDAAFTTCLNPLHRFHRVPHPLQPMPSVLVDCCKLCNRMLNELNGLYPGFPTGIQWHNT